MNVTQQSDGRVADSSGHFSSQINVRTAERSEQLFTADTLYGPGPRNRVFDLRGRRRVQSFYS